MNKKILYGMIALLSVSFLFLGCPTGTSSDDGTATTTWPDDSGQAGPGPEATTPITNGNFNLDSTATTLNPPGLSASAEQGLESGDITVTLSSAAAGVPIGLPAAQASGDFQPDWFTATEAAKHDYFVFALKGLEGGETTTRIKQTNGGFVMYDGIALKTPPVTDNLIHYYNGVYTKEKLWTNTDFNPVGSFDAEGVYRFEFNILIVKGKSPVKLEITPEDDPARKYTVTINYSGVTFVGGALPGTDTKEDYVNPTTGIYNDYGSGVTVGVSSLTKQAGADNYTAEVASTGGAIGGGPASLPGDTTTAAHPYTDMSAALWAGTNAARTNVITFDFYKSGNGKIFDDYSTGTITIKQVNPAFVVYEEYLKTSGGVWTPVAGQDYAGYYANDTNFKWSAENGHILYKEKGGYTYDAAGLDNFNILIMDGAQPEEVIFTFTFTTSGGTVTRGLKVDYSDVVF
jgi:hypothetical protein